jgi:hypothetical protein
MRKWRVVLFVQPYVPNQHRRRGGNVLKFFYVFENRYSMIEQIKIGVGGSGFWGSNLVQNFRQFKLLQFVALSVIMLQVQSRGLAQGNIADLYNWSNETMDGSDPNPNDYIQISSFSSALFYGGYTDEGGGVSPTILGNFDTTPGATYQISFTMQNLNSFDSSASESFGDNATNFDLPFVYINGGESYTDTPVNIDFTAVATFSTTTMSIEYYLDPDGGAASLSDLMVTEVSGATGVPEISSTQFFCFGGCALLLARQLRALFAKRKRN